MATVDIKTLVRRYYEEVVSTGAVDRVPEFVSAAKASGSSAE